MVKQISKPLFYVAKIVFAVLILSILIERISLQEIRAAFVNARFHLIIVAAALLPLNLYCQYRKWKTLVRQHVAALEKEILLSLLVGFALGIITPARLGEYARVLFIRNSHKMSLLGLTLLDKLYTLSMVFSTGLIAMVLYLWFLFSAGLNIALLLAALALFYLFFGVLGNPKKLQKWTRHPKLDTFLSRHQNIRTFVKAIDLVAPNAAKELRNFSLLLVFTFTFQFTLLIMAFTSISPWNGLITASAILTTKIFFPFAIGDLGVRESIAIFYLQRYQVIPAAAFDASLLLFLINILIPAFVGLLLLLKSRINGFKF